MSELPPTDDLPAPRPVRASSRGPWGRVAIVVVAAAVGLGGAALASDASREEAPAAEAEATTVRPVPVLAAGADGAALSDAVALYGIEAWSSPTRGFVLSAWGAAFSSLLGDDVGGIPEDDPSATFADDPRLVDPAGAPGFVDDCAGAEPGDPVPDGCPAGEPGAVLGGDAPPANVAAVVAFPHPDVVLADECPFADVGDDELPIAVITGNPGTVVVRFGAQQVEVESDEQERTEWEAWLADPAGPRPPGSFVAHCIAVPDPAGTGPLEISVTAVDDQGQVASAQTMVIRAEGDLPPATVTPIDGTMVRVDVPVAEGAPDPFIGTRTVAEFGASPPTCEGIGATPQPSTWRIGADATAEVAPAAGDRPWLEAAPIVHRLTFPLAEGEPTFVCLSRPDDTGPNTTHLLITPPDARRLRLSVTGLELTEALDANDLQVRGTFAELGWTPCGALLPAAAAGPGVVEPGVTGVLCSSGGDSGAVAAAGGVLDISVRSGPATHVVRIALSAVPGGGATDVYRIPIPAPDLEGTLCTDGVDQPGCIEPAGAAVLGSIELTAAWEEGPIGPAQWQVEPAPES